MIPSLILYRIFAFLLPPCLLSLTYLYAYPVINGCSFPAPKLAKGGPGGETCAFGSKNDTNLGHIQGEREGGRSLVEALDWKKWFPASEKAPFRLLALGDPQLEGDSSIPQLPQIRLPTAREIIARDGNALKESWDSLGLFVQVFLFIIRKTIDLWGNDWYLAHVYRSMHWWTEPTHQTVLGDLLGSQWVSDEEFESRSTRFWTRAFRGGKRVDDELMSGQRGRTEVLGADPRWSERLINVVGNHDIGYAGDIDEKRIQRWERNFGKVNWDIAFTLSNTSAVEEEPKQDGITSTPSIRLLILNSMNLDTLAISGDLQKQTYDFVNEVIGSSHPVEDRRHLTILLTHIPLHKEKGVCFDAPFFDFWDDSSVKEQNHISADVSKGAVLEGLFGLSGNPYAPASGKGRKGIILTGHDHEGCDVFHHISTEPVSVANSPDDSVGEASNSPPSWQATQFKTAKREGLITNPSVNGIREVTVRSMMGDYGGNAAMLSAWWDETIQEWTVEVAMCAVGIQHVWWGIHTFAAIELVLFLAAVVTYLREVRPDSKPTKPTTGPQSGKSPKAVKAKATSDQHGEATPLREKEQKAKRKKLKENGGS